MELEVRTKEGIMVTKITGKLAMFTYQKLSEATEHFKCERKLLKKVGEPNEVAKPELVFLSIKYSKFPIADGAELWFEPNDYITVK